MEPAGAARQLTPRAASPGQGGRPLWSSMASPRVPLDCRGRGVPGGHQGLGGAANRGMMGELTGWKPVPSVSPRGSCDAAVPGRGPSLLPPSRGPPTSLR